jgi:hypothetical protein
MQLTAAGLVDSGSTMTFIHTEFVDILGLTGLRDPCAIGAGARFQTWVGKLDVLEVIKDVTPSNSFRDIYVHIPKTMGAILYTVLGRDLIFKHFDITFPRI